MGAKSDVDMGKKIDDVDAKAEELRLAGKITKLEAKIGELSPGRLSEVCGPTVCPVGAQFCGRMEVVEEVDWQKEIKAAATGTLDVVMDAVRACATSVAAARSRMDSVESVLKEMCSEVEKRRAKEVGLQEQVNEIAETIWRSWGTSVGEGVGGGRFGEDVVALDRRTSLTEEKTRVSLRHEERCTVDRPGKGLLFPKYKLRAGAALRGR